MLGLSGMCKPPLNQYGYVAKLKTGETTFSSCFNCLFLDILGGNLQVTNIVDNSFCFKCTILAKVPGSQRILSI
jgi:hypothetical protein